MGKYNHRNCQSLFGYGCAVHVRSKFVCQLCGCDASNPPNFDLFRQMTVEHLVGESQGGYLPQIRLAVAERFPTLEKLDQLRIAELIHDANTVTACHFCNSMTSRHRHGFNMVDLLALEGSPDEVVAVVVSQLAKVLGQKQSDIAVKNQAVREAFEAEILPAMQNRKP